MTTKGNNFILTLLFVFVVPFMFLLLFYASAEKSNFFEPPENFEEYISDFEVVRDFALDNKDKLLDHSSDNSFYVSSNGNYLYYHTDELDADGLIINKHVKLNKKVKKSLKNCIKCKYFDTIVIHEKQVSFYFSPSETSPEQQSIVYSFDGKRSRNLTGYHGYICPYFYTQKLSKNWYYYQMQ